MSVYYSTNLGLTLINNGTETGTWGDLTNTNFGTLVEQAITGVLYISMTSGNVTLTSTNGVLNQSRNAVIVATGTQTVTNSITIPNVAKTYLVNNTSSFQVNIQVSGGSAYTCPTGTISTVYCDGLGVAAGSSVSTSAPITQYVPSGSVFWYAASTAPTGYLYCNGAAVSRSVYAALFAVVGTTYGVGDGSTTFNLPELRGEFIRGYNNQPSTGLDPGRVFASTQTDIIKNHTHPATSSVSDPGHTHLYGTFGAPAGSGVNGGADYVFGSPTTNSNTTGISVGTTISNNTGGSTTETRPVNMALLPCIKT